MSAPRGSVLLAAERAARRRWPSATCWGIRRIHSRWQAWAQWWDEAPFNRLERVLGRSLFGVGPTYAAAIEAAR